MYDLTTSQQNIWNLHQFYPDTSISDNCGAIFFGEKCDHALLNRAINKLIELQSGMRLRFCEKDGYPVQYFTEYHYEQFESMYFESESSFEAFAACQAKMPFPLVDSPMYRFVIFDLEDRTGILLCASHLISDAWAISIIASTVYHWYYSFLGAQAPDERECSFRTILEAEQNYLTSARYEKDREYWSQQYQGRPEVSAIRPGSSPVEHPDACRYTTRVSGELTAAINRFYHEHNVSQAVLFEAAIMTYLSRINPENRNISLGMLVLNRSGAQEKRVVGTCISTMPLTISFSGGETAMELCRSITREHVRVFRHQRYPYSYILRDLHVRFGFSGNLYDVMVSYQNAQTGTDSTTKWFSNGYCEVPLEFHIDNRDDSDQFTLNIDYQTELFSGEEIRLLTNRILYILEQIISDPDGSLQTISILPPEEYRMVTSDFNRTDIAYPRNKCVHDLFAEQVLKHPGKTALVFGEERFTYKKLDEMSNALAHFLRDNGVGPGAIVPVISVRSWHVIVAMLGILKSGAAYMCVDPAYPGERIDDMFEIAGATLALTYRYSGRLTVHTVSLENFDFSADCSSVSSLNRPDDLCYVIFTSGSTGKPKGVSLCHRNVVNYCNCNVHNICGKIMKEGDSIVSVMNTIFDIFVTESWLPLLNGICIFLADDEQVVSQRKLADLISANTIDVMQTTPTKMRSYILDKQNLDYLRNLKAIALGGETLPAELLQQLRGLMDAGIYNVYGPAETTVWSTIKEMTDDCITVGTPVANTQVYVLDSKLQPMPVGVAGELCISGDGVGVGYLNRPDLTAEKFVPDPFRPGNILYRTGDLARWRSDGEIEHLGRMDTQVKIRGLRIELGEIESVMSGFGGIGLVAVTDKRDDAGRQYLVGYYTAESSIDESALRQYLSAKLPKYMVPNYFVCLDEMPMTASGKTDRKNLPAPVFAEADREYTAPETAREKILCEILEGLLQPDRIGVTDNFFELGGDSLAAIEYVAQAHNNGIDFALQNVFDYPTVRSLCEFLGEKHIRKVVYDQADFRKYAPLLQHNVIDEKFVPERKSLGNVLITGSTGFLGAHVLDRYLQEETGTAYCLVRGGAERLRSILDYYFDGRYGEEFGRRIIAVEGDITRPDLAQDLSVDIQTVIHTAATVKHYGPYDYFHRVNVQGTRNVISFAKRIGAGMLHISTISVSGNSLVDAFDVCRVEEPLDFTERDLYINQPLDNVYIRSKFEAERAVMDAMLEGLDAKIIRVGNLSNRISDYRFQPNYHANAYLNRVKAALELGALPDYMIPLYAEFSPVDQTAEGIVKIGQYARKQTVFNLNSNQNLYFDRMLQILNALGIRMEVLQGHAFNTVLQNLAKDEKTAYIYEAFQNDMDEKGRLVYDSNIHICNDFTVWFMKKLNFEWAKIDFAYIQGYVEYFRQIGYLKV